MLSFYVSLVETEEEKSLVEDLYIKYEQDMYNVAFSILHNKYDAEDAVQEAFLRVIENLDKISRVPADERGYYVVIISRNTSINLYNKRKRINEYPLEDIDKMEDDYSIEDMLDTKYSVEKIKSILAKLAETDFEVLNMSLIHGFSNEEISQMLGIGNGAVRQRICKAKKNLRKALEKENIYG